VLTFQELYRAINFAFPSKSFRVKDVRKIVHLGNSVGTVPVPATVPLEVLAKQSQAIVGARLGNMAVNARNPIQLTAVDTTIAASTATQNVTCKRVLA